MLSICDRILYLVFKTLCAAFANVSVIKIFLPWISQICALQTLSFNLHILIVAFSEFGLLNDYTLFCF